MEISTDEWRNYQKGYVEKWLADVISAQSRLKSINSQLDSEYEAYDMIKGIAYDKESQKTERLHGDDAMVSHISHIEQNIEELKSLESLYAKKISVARSVLSQLNSHQFASAIMMDIYLCGKSRKDVAEGINYCMQRVDQIIAMAKVECYWLMPVECREKVIRADY